ncbi:ACT domain-containing protein [Dactylosporangium sp. NPDC051484]|uniref:ACT domain-containing protein n=1 Tax=Dactylosporangium sp. NPDC051484 TaxID=3154942 RepID=UPI00344DF3B0
MTLWRIRATVDDRPGFLSVLTASLALRKVNILSVQVHTTESGAVDDFLVEAPDALTRADLVDAVQRGRGRDPWVAQADVRGLIDEPTRVLALATKVLEGSATLEEAIAALLGDCDISWRAGASTGTVGFTATGMQLRDPAGGTLYVRRPAPVFTPAEYARAHALVELARVAAKRTAA